MKTYNELRWDISLGRAAVRGQVIDGVEHWRLVRHLAVKESEL